MTIYLGADHGGFDLKEQVKQFLLKENYSVVDLGATSLDPDDDYPQFAWQVANKVAEDDVNRGILFCRSGGGMVIVANKVKGIRAVAVDDVRSAQHARDNNNANIISLAGDWLKDVQVEQIVDVFLKTDFDQTSRHQRRVKQIKDLEQGK